MSAFLEAHRPRYIGGNMAAASQPSTAHIALCAEQPLPVSGTADVPEFVHLLPAGKILTRDGRGPYRLDDATAVIAGSLAKGASLPIDENHSTDLAAPKGAPAPARGWIVELQARADGIWGRVQWTDEGRGMVASRAYRHISPVIAYDATGRVHRILRASLVNEPNLVSLTALNAANATANPEPFIMDLTKLIEMLGLPADADEAAVIEAIRALSQKAGTQDARPDPTKWVSIEQFQQAVAEANKLRQGISKHAAEEQVAGDIRKGVILPWMKDWAIELCMASAPSYEKFLRGVGPGFSGLLQSQLQGREPSAFRSCGSDLTEEEKAIARNLGLTDADYAASRGND
jgi:phage I-like protein